MFGIVAASEEGGHVAGSRGADRRVQKTRSLLHGALASLIHEKSYDALVVKEILARADVGRSTFYAHFRDKDDLLDTAIRDVLRASDRSPPTGSTALAERVIRFSLPMLEHIERHRNASEPLADVGAQAAVHDHLQRILVDVLADDLNRARQSGRTRREDVPIDLLARHLASTFLVVVDWWLGSAVPAPASRANDLYRALIVPSLTAILD